jgi:ring-1,2-phenylacetyl-CoA epoxidase subunit PaaA
LRERYVQKFVPLLLAGGFTIPDPDLRQDSETGKWKISDIDWQPLMDTMRNIGPDSSRRISDAKRAWYDAEWVRTALDDATKAPA